MSGNYLLGREMVSLLYHKIHSGVRLSITVAISLLYALKV